MKQKRLTICKTYGVNVKNILQSMTVISSRRLQVEQQAEETRRDTLDQLRMTTRAPGHAAEFWHPPMRATP
ncbi:hypothetical protein K1T71_013979 [Dendrolimus kikuchii]|uniref:Uncharacterized protein n=1 Tax=Dendrolimus kikuchii TaxID=765133 RepID=A0ACC1CGG8_9NEOP|nr:hypothetical protein K1T71_013979 [Dendrolimus kikuchii]